MRWFGVDNGAPVYTTCEHCDTPVGERCQYCREDILEGDTGFELPVAGLPGQVEDVVYYHRKCLLKNVGVQ